MRRGRRLGYWRRGGCQRGRQRIGRQRRNRQARRRIDGLQHEARKLWRRKLAGRRWAAKQHRPTHAGHQEHHGKNKFLPPICHLGPCSWIKNTTAPRCNATAFRPIGPLSQGSLPPRSATGENRSLNIEPPWQMVRADPQPTARISGASADRSDQVDFAGSQRGGSPGQSSRLEARAGRQGRRNHDVFGPGSSASWWRCCCPAKRAPRRRSRPSG